MAIFFPVHPFENDGFFCQASFPPTLLPRLPHRDRHFLDHGFSTPPITVDPSTRAVADPYRAPPSLGDRHRSGLSVSAAPSSLGTPGTWTKLLGSSAPVLASDSVNSEFGRISLRVAPASPVLASLSTSRPPRRRRSGPAPNWGRPSGITHTILQVLRLGLLYFFVATPPELLSRTL